MDSITNFFFLVLYFTNRNGPIFKLAGSILKMFPDRLEIQLEVTFSLSDLNNRKYSYLLSSNSIRRLLVSIFLFFS